MFSLRTAFHAAFVLCICGSSLVFAGGQQRPHHKISPDAAAQSSSDTIPVIIQYKQDLDQPALLNLKGRGALVRRSLHSIRAVHAQVPRSVLEELANDSNVEYISPDRPVL